jgi:hypothetical protein
VASVQMEAAVGQLKCGIPNRPATRTRRVAATDFPAYRVLSPVLNNEGDCHG